MKDEPHSESEMAMATGEISGGYLSDLGPNDMSSWIAAETDYLEANFPKEMATHYYAAILAANDGNQKKAAKEIKTANRLGLPDEDMNAFLAASL